MERYCTPTEGRHADSHRERHDRRQADHRAARDGGLRIAGEGEESFALSAVPQPEPEDQVVEQDGATVYLDTAAAEQLGDKVLDAGVDDAGNLQFALMAPPPAGV